jgi:hypothetical protein
MIAEQLIVSFAASVFPEPRNSAAVIAEQFRLCEPLLLCFPLTHSGNLSLSRITRHI